MKSENTERLLKVGITQGDINGISYEIILKTLQEPEIFQQCIPILYGSPKVAAYHKKALNITNVNFNNIKSPDEAVENKAYLINSIDDNARVELGKSTSYAGFASFKSLEKAVDDLQQNKIDILVTAPINKNNIQSNDFKFPGHTEYLTSKFNADDSLMLMVGELFKIGVITGHTPITKVAGQITYENILSKLRILNQSLISDFAIRKPVIAVLGLNPHAGDNGIIGSEESQILIPAIRKAREENIMALGPYPADGFFRSTNYTKFDAIMAMYHDQGLIPFKALQQDEGVNFTAGLSIIRTSPAHGTAYDLAGKNEASAESFKKAILLSIEIHKNRILYKDAVNSQKITNEILEGEDSDVSKLIELTGIKEPDFLGEADFIGD